MRDVAGCVRSQQAFLRDLLKLPSAAGTPYMIVGSLASSYHTRPRATQDIDVVIVRKERSFSRSDFERRREVDVPDGAAVMGAPEDVMLAKLEWGKASGTDRHHRDALGIAQVQGAALDVEHLRRWAPSHRSATVDHAPRRTANPFFGQPVSARHEAFEGRGHGGVGSAAAARRHAVAGIRKSGYRHRA